MLTSPYDTLYGPSRCTPWNKCIPLEFLKKTFDPRIKAEYVHKHFKKNLNKKFPEHFQNLLKNP